MPVTVATLYADRVAAGEIERDGAQWALVERLTTLNRRLETFRLARKSSALGWLFSRRDRTEAPIRGLYIHGEVGRGKTMVMDLFFEACPVIRKRRAHFHQFMADVHERVFAYRQKIKSGAIADEDPIKLVAADIAAESWLLCFDEFHVDDIADAMILGRLFTRLFEAGVVVVATSNIEPDRLYEGGLNRALFVPFIGLMQQYMDVVHLDARADYRMEKLAGLPVWYAPTDEDAYVAMDSAWQRLTGSFTGDKLDLVVKGRIVHVPQAAMGVARFTFHELCELPLGASDYLRIANEFHTILLENVPIMAYENRNAAKRFIILIDMLYDNAVKLVASAAAEPQELYKADIGYEANEFKRTVSRLIEMRSDDYLALPHGRRAGNTGSTEGLVET